MNNEDSKRRNKWINTVSRNYFMIRGEHSVYLMLP